MKTTLPTGERCELPDKELIDTAKKMLSKLCKTGGRSFQMTVPVDFNNDTDMVFSELIRRYDNAVNLSGSTETPCT